jgi:Tol biopolymer transport system component
VLVAVPMVIALAVVVGVPALRADDDASRARVDTKTTSTTPVPPSATIPAGLLGRVAWVDGKALVTASASQPRRRVMARGPVTNPKWSPNGRWLAYTRSDGLHVVSAAGKQVQLILTKSDYEWSPQGNSIAWTDGKLRVTDVTTGNESTIATKSYVSGFGWSPDGRQLAVASLDPGEPTLGFDVVDAASGTRRTVPFVAAEYQASRFNPLFIAGWEPDGKAALVWVDLMGSGSIAQDGLDLWLVPLDGSAPHNLGQTLVKRQWIQWSPDGTQLAIVRSNWRGANDGPRAVTICATSGECAPISEPDVATADPAWSPDGRELAFVRKPAKQAMPEVHGNRVDWRSLYAARQLWISNADGSDARELAGAGSGVASPRWSADGKHILFVRDDALRAFDLTKPRAVRVVAPIAPVPVFENGYRANGAPPDVPYEAGSGNGYPTWESLVAWTQ